MNNYVKLTFLVLLFAVIIITVKLTNTRTGLTPVESITQSSSSLNETLFPMAIEALRQREYLGGQFVLVQPLAKGSNYEQSVVTYQSEGLTIRGLLTVPITPQPDQGYPAILFVHGYIPPKEYSTTGNYVSYQAYLARSGFVTFKPDLRGHGQSEGEPVSAHFSEKYVVDTLHAISYLQQHAQVNPERIGYWGHSNGGETGLRVVVISKEIKAASFWAGVVGSFPDMLEKYNDQIPFLRDRDDPLIQEHGLPKDNPEFWNQIDPYAYLSNIDAPIQLHHGTADTSVPEELSQRLRDELVAAGKQVEYFEYAGDNHNLSNNLNLAWQRTIDFFLEHL